MNQDIIMTNRTMEVIEKLRSCLSRHYRGVFMQCPEDDVFINLCAVIDRRDDTISIRITYGEHLDHIPVVIFNVVNVPDSHVERILKAINFVNNTLSLSHLVLGIGNVEPWAVYLQCGLFFDGQLNEKQFEALMEESINSALVYRKQLNQLLEDPDGSDAAVDKFITAHHHFVQKKVKKAIRDSRRNKPSV